MVDTRSVRSEDEKHRPGWFWVRRVCQEGKDGLELELEIESEWTSEVVEREEVSPVDDFTICLVQTATCRCLFNSLILLGHIIRPLRTQDE